MRILCIVFALATTAAMQAFRPASLAAQDPAPSETRPSFSEFLDGIRTEALSRGIREEIVHEALANVEEPMPVVLERDRTQAEVVLPLETYIDRRLTRDFVRTGREMFAVHRAALEEIGYRYGVAPRFVVAIWGIESNYGRFSGVRPTIAALATLAWDPRRSTFFRGELFNALDILNRGDIDLPRLRGSWAGAMGQVQFMPSSYLQYAEDFDGDGRRDIWSTRVDVFASIANYLKGHGWIEGEPWGREVKIRRDAERRIAAEVERRTGSCEATRDMTATLPAAKWTKLGVRTVGGGSLPSTTPDAALVSGQSRHFLVHANYDALLQYNCAHSYAITVGLLADRVSAPSVAPRKAARRNARK